MAIRILFWFGVGPCAGLFELASNPNLSGDQAEAGLLVQQFSLPSVIPLLAIESPAAGASCGPVPEKLDRAFVPFTLLLGLAPLLGRLCAVAG